MADSDAKRAALVLVRRGGKILAVSRGRGSDQWGMPGGHVELGESFEGAAIRELREETGLGLSSAREVFRDVSGDHLTAAFAGDVTGALRASEEGDVAWVDPEVLTDEQRSPFAAYARKLFAEMNHLMDLGPGDVHIPSAGENFKPTQTPTAATMAEISTQQRNALPTGKFADPAERKYPVDTKARADNAAARLEQQKGAMSAGKYARIKSRIKRAQKKFGETPKTATSSSRMRPGRGLRMVITQPDGTKHDIRHMATPDEGVFVFPSLPIPAEV